MKCLRFSYICYLFLIGVLFFNCKKSNNRIPDESIVTLDECSFYAIVNDSLWCGEITSAVYTSSKDELEITIGKKSDFNGDFPEEEIYFFIPAFNGIGTYSMEDGNGQIFKRVAYDINSYLFSINQNKGDTGAIEVTSYSDITQIIEGEIRFHASSGNDKKRVTGGRFRAVVK